VADEVVRFASALSSAPRGIRHELENQLVDPPGLLMLDPVRGVFDELQSAVQAEVDAGLRHFAADELVLCSPDQQCRHVNPRGHYLSPCAVSSGEGFVQMMKCLPQVTTVGLPTRGASGNPKPFAMSRTGLTVYFSSWVDMLPDGQPIEGVGIAPDTRVEALKSSYATADATLEKGLETLRAKVATVKPR
jgi:hypothetical protein